MVPDPPSQARMATTVLAEIRCGSLLAVDLQRTIVIGVSPRPGTWPVIVQVGDEGRVMRMAMMDGVVMPRKRRCRDHGKNCGRPNKSDH